MAKAAVEVSGLSSDLGPGMRRPTADTEVFGAISPEVTLDRALSGLADTARRAAEAAARPKSGRSAFAEALRNWATTTV